MLISDAASPTYLLYLMNFIAGLVIGSAVTRRHRLIGVALAVEPGFAVDLLLSRFEYALFAAPDALVRVQTLEHELGGGNLYLRAVFRFYPDPFQFVGESLDFFQPLAQFADRRSI